MKRVSPFNTNVKQMCTMIDKGTIVFDNPYQRPSGQWTDADATTIIDSVFTFFIPELTAIKEKRIVGDKELNVYDTVDGGQRATYLHSFKNDGYKLGNVEPFILEADGEEYDISGLKFSDFPEILKEEFNSFSIAIRPVELEEGEDKAEVSRKLVDRLNKGAKMSNSHLAIVRAKPETSEFVQQKVNGHPLFTNVAHFADGSVRKSEPQMSVFQALALVGRYEVKDYGTANITDLFVKTKVDEDIFDKVSRAFDFIENTLPEYAKFMTKVFIPVVTCFIINNNFNENVRPFLQHYVNNNKRDDAYRRWSKGGTTKKDSINGRINGLQKLYEEYMSTQRSE
ncbi:hypothetical protein F4V43_02335 [Paenibacillus spiritus]|uniref:DUF262 domain-containing protein n=1 Tax=Paenibacillus spiritus TaxID=2496557 RepID=A0A5J5GIL3_9BACL|nr:hypothetical protein [Paenibacillus spiritus]KAA9007344.1 hypothetical protein F4V43_02335 [Paenibacillus spiritus]